MLQFPILQVLNKNIFKKMAHKPLHLHIVLLFLFYNV